MCPRKHSFSLFAALALLGAIALNASAGLLAPGQNLRLIPFSLGDADKAMINARVGNKAGRLLFDNGTPDMLFLNREGTDLLAGRFVARGFAASGQPIEVHEHPSPPVTIAGQPVKLAQRVRSGNFGFAELGFGDDFLGFIGTPMVERDAFVLDYGRHHLALLKTQADGSLGVAPPKAADIVASTHFMLWPGGQPTFAASLGKLPVITDIDTGDSGTLYVSAATRQQLLSGGLLQADGSRWRLGGLSIAGVLFEPLLVQLVEAGSTRDFRHGGQPDQLRLGASFLRDNPCLWNFPAKTLTFLKSDADFLERIDAAGRR